MTMFVVRCSSPLDGEWEARDKVILRAWEKRPDDSCAGSDGRGHNYREHAWVVISFGEARQLKHRLEAVPGMGAVTIREHTTPTY